MSPELARIALEWVSMSISEFVTLAETLGLEVTITDEVPHDDGINMQD